MFVKVKNIVTVKKKKVLNFVTCESIPKRRANTYKPIELENIKKKPLEITIPAESGQNRLLTHYQTTKF